MFSTRRVPRARCVVRRVEAMEPRVLLAVTPVSVGNPSFEQSAGPGWIIGQRWTSKNIPTSTIFMNHYLRPDFFI